ncbi:MAG: CTP synthase ura7 [Watsoniomyces obsoletus]|nr:MAG: CTP synthase ura7 [Watsoniomyces obsoletus]
MKYVLVSGGVISGIGKGVIASSTGLLLKTIGLKVSSIKIDPYMNVDAGTMAPTEHGEVFVLDDGGEVDLDLGNYERYLNITLTRENNITTGRIYQHVIEKERRGDYLGRTVQVVPHLTDAIQDWIERVARIPVDDTNQEPDICIIELGGTVGDIESGPFIEAMRQLRRRAGKDNFLQIHVSLIPVVNGEQKTKPTQQAIKDVRSAGLSPDLIACRCSEPLEKSTTDKLAMFCQVESEQVVAVHDVSSTYHVPLLLEGQGLIGLLHQILRLDQVTIPSSLLTKGQETWQEWKTLTVTRDRLFESVSIALVGKYTNLRDSYLSVIKSLEHAAMRCSKRLNLIWVDAVHLEQPTSISHPAEFHKAWHEICTAHGILVPGGFGLRGTEGMMAAARWARQNKTPFLGICFGMQLAVIEFARNVCGLEEASSIEIDEGTKDPVVIFMPEIDKDKLGGTMRLGLRPTLFQEGCEGWSKMRKLYLGHSPNNSISSNQPLDQQDQKNEKKENVILERHRHRYEVNPAYIPLLSSHGLHFVGKDDKGERMEILELKDHPWYVGVQFHPEYLSRVLRPSKPYLGFVAASAGCLEDFVGEMNGEIDGGGIGVDIDVDGTGTGAVDGEIGKGKGMGNVMVNGV